MSDENIIILGKVAIGAGCGILALILVRWRRYYEIRQRQFDLSALAFLAVSRVALFIGLFFILGKEPTSDVGVYTSEGRAVLDGLLVYRDFKSSYAPVFPYLIAGILLIWNSAKAVVLTSILIELLSLPLWLKVGRRWFSERTVRTAALLYITSAPPLTNVAMLGQNQVWLASVLAVSLLLIGRQDFASGLVFGVTLAAIKLLGLLFAPVLWLFAPKRLAWSIGFVTLPMLAYVAILISGVTVEQAIFPVLFQGDHVTSANPLYLTTLFGVDLGPEAVAIRRISSAFMLLALVVVFLAAWARGAARDSCKVVFLLTLVLLIVFLFGKKSYSHYLILVFFPLCLTFASRPIGWFSLVLFVVFSGVAVIEPNLWFHWLEQGDLSLLWQDELPAGLTRPTIGAFAAINVFIVACYIWLTARTCPLVFGRLDGVSIDGPQPSEEAQ